jgi:Uma2 family endonuclease
VQLHRLGVIVQEQALTGFTRNDYAPDICFWNAAKSATIGRNTTIYPIPDLIAEVISPSTESYDRGVKFEDYAAHGVGEYWTIDPEALTIEQYLLQQGGYELGSKLSQGFIVATAIAGFQMPIAAAFDDQANLAALRQILA